MNDLQRAMLKKEKGDINSGKKVRFNLFFRDFSFAQNM